MTAQCPRRSQLHALETVQRLPDGVQILAAGFVFALDALQFGAERLQPGEVILDCDLHRRACRVPRMESKW